MRAQTASGTSCHAGAKPRPAIGIDAIRLRAGEKRGAFVDLIERIRHHDRSARATGVDDRLRECEQRFAAAEHRQHLGRRIERRKSVPAHEPAGDRLAQRERAERSWDNCASSWRLRPAHRERDAGVGCRGSPIDRLIGANARLGATSATSCRSRSNGYGLRRERRGFKWRKRCAGCAPDYTAAVIASLDGDFRRAQRRCARRCGLASAETRMADPDGPTRTAVEPGVFAARAVALAPAAGPATLAAGALLALVARALGLAMVRSRQCAAGDHRQRPGDVGIRDRGIRAVWSGARGASNRASPAAASLPSDTRLLGCLRLPQR